MSVHLRQGSGGHVTLESLATCFQGILPAQLFTCSLDGIPNAAYLSHVEYVDHAHVALSFQFFNKSRRNVAENPNALVMVPDPDTGPGLAAAAEVRAIRDRGPAVRSDGAADRGDRVVLRPQGNLQAARRRRLRSAVDRAGARGSRRRRRRAGSTRTPRRCVDAIFTTRALQDLAGYINRADSLEALVDSILRGLDESLGFKHSAILVPTEEAGVLVTIATRGYPENGAGAEVRFGEGHRRPRGRGAQADPHFGADARHALRLRDAQGGRGRGRRSASRAPRFPMPGLANPESQLGVPLLVRGELVGVLCLESDVPYRFHEEDKASIELLGSYLAIAVQNMQLQERSAEAPTDAPRRPRRPAGAASRPPRRARPRAPRRRLLRGRRVHPARRRVPDPKPAGEDSVAAAERAREHRAAGIHQPRAAAGQVAEPSRVEGQPGEPAAAAAPPARRKEPRHPPRPPRPRAVRPRAGM